MQFWFIGFAILFYVLRFRAETKKRQQKAKQQAAKTDAAPPADKPTFKSWKDLQAEMYRQMEMKSKPFARPEQKSKQAVDQKKTVPLLVVKERGYQPMTTLPEQEIKIAVSAAFKKSTLNFNLRQAVIGSVVLNRPDY